jgi:prevent-host-death family protein
VKPPTATTISVSDARRSLHALIQRAQREGESYIITRHGEPAATLVPVSVYEDWQGQEREAFFDLVRDMQKEADLSPEEADRVAEDAASEIRSEI